MEKELNFISLIRDRHSTRNYSQYALTDADRAQILETVAGAVPLDSGIHLDWKIADHCSDGGQRAPVRRVRHVRRGAGRIRLPGRAVCTRPARRGMGNMLVWHGTHARQPLFDRPWQTWHTGRTISRAGRIVTRTYPQVA